MSMTDALASAATQSGEGGAHPEAGGAAAPIRPEAGGEGVSETGPSPEEVEAEARAKSTGWRGPSPKFPDANSWNEYAEDNLPLIQSANRKLEAELTKLRQADDERERRVEERIDRAVKVVLAGFDRQLKNDRADYEARWDTHIRAASQRGEDIGPLLAQKRDNMAAWDAKAAKEREAQEKDSRVEAEKKTTTEQPAEEPEEWKTWKGDNEWWGSDEDLTAYAHGLSNRMPAEVSSRPLADQLTWITDKVKASPLYLAKYGRSAPPRASAVGTTPPRGPNGQFVADNLSKLSTEDRRDFDYIWKSLNGAPYHGETDKDKALRKFADRLVTKA